MGNKRKPEQTSTNESITSVSKRQKITQEIMQGQATENQMMDTSQEQDQEQTNENEMMDPSTFDDILDFTISLDEWDAIFCDDG